MKALLFCFGLFMGLFAGLSSSAQMYSTENSKGKTESLIFYVNYTAIARLNDSGEWGKFSEWEPNDIKIVVTSDRVTINSKSPSRLRIIEYGDERRNADGNKYVPIECIDQDGIACTLKLLFHEDSDQVYLEYSNVNIVYSVPKK